MILKSLLMAEYLLYKLLRPYKLQHTYLMVCLLPICIGYATNRDLVAVPVIQVEILRCIVFL